MLAAAISFAVFYSIGNYVLDHMVYGRSFAERMESKVFDRLQTFIRYEKITPGNLRPLNAWAASQDNTYLVLFIDGQQVFESSIDPERDYYAAEIGFVEEYADQRFQLTFANGVVAEAYIYYFADEAFYIWMSAIAGVLSFIVFSLCFISLVQNKLRVIQKLKKAVDTIAGGDLEQAVVLHENDELGELAEGIDQMRESILNHQREEREIRAANSQLVTAMSHDLRTPLTSQMVYLEMLDLNKVSSDDQRQHLIHQSLLKAQTIKNMADKLFEYFLVYTTECEQPVLEKTDADEALRQFWQEYAFELENHGFTVNLSLDEMHGCIAINPELMQRVFDNLYSNLLKYASKAQPIDITCRKEDGQACLCISNAIASRHSKHQSTNIGLSTCRRILSIHNGYFDTVEEDGRFTSVISIPLFEPE